MDEPQVIITSYTAAEARPQQQEYPAVIANYLASRCPKGLVVHECECGAQRWALPWDDAMERWVSHQISSIRDILEEKGFKPEWPGPSQHVVLASPEDAPCSDEDDGEFSGPPMAGV